MNIKKHLETATNIILLLVTLMIAAGFIKNTFFRQSSAAVSEASFLSPGNYLSAPADYDWHSHDQTLVLALQKGCVYCANSMPFYQRLAALEATHKINTHLFAVFPNDRFSVQSELMSHHLDLNNISDTKLSSIHVTQTPTLILVDNVGHIIKSWVGQLAPDAETEVIQYLHR